MKLFFITYMLMAISVTHNTFAEDDAKLELDLNVRKGLHSGQYVILLRHALAPGIGDPDDFSIRDCSTQRNLSAQGRRQAQHIGKSLKANGIERAAVFSSQWCRCLETANLLDFGKVSELPIINSFFRDYGRQSEQTQALKEWLIKNRYSHKDNPPLPTILVTHQVNITALTGIFPDSGELVIIEVDKSGTVSVTSRLETKN